MLTELDGAKILMISEKGHYGYITMVGSLENSIEICYLAICKYDTSSTVYLFLCDKNMSVENDVDFTSVEEAIQNACSRSETQINWIYPNNRQ